MKTFYMAGRSEDKELVKRRAAYLVSFGMIWAFNWTEFEDQDFEPDGYPVMELARHGVVDADLRASAGADLFVYNASHYGISLGASVELGVRIASGKNAVVVLNGAKRHIFFDHRLVRVYATWEELKTSLYNGDWVA